ncbi:MAG: PQQ-binding-like beta-propeller repeat protein, partial [Patescibacteria group bacterium]|nr:PQQ-binding-like beta-propeller repeat protein [Patescibacteria group bacterium]
MVRIGLIGGVFSAIVCALLLYDYSLRQADDPAETIAFKAMKAALRDDPTNEGLKEELRQIDQVLRYDYFRRRTFASVGGVLLLAGAVVTLIAATRATVLNRPVPTAESLGPPGDLDTPLARLARWGTGGIGIALAVTAAGLSFAYRSPFGEWDAENVATTGSASSPDSPPSAASYSPPAREAIVAAWPRFRGPNGSGISAYDNVPKEWDAATGKNIRWKAEVPLPGNSSPIAWENRLFVTGADQQRREVFCFDADSGKLLWQAEAPGTPQSKAEPPKVMDDTGFAAPTPVTDGRHVFAIFASGDMAAFDYDGKLVWSHSFGIPDNTYGHAASLAMHDGLVFVQMDVGHQGPEEKSRLYAMNAATGAIAWQVKRAVPNSWSSPIVVEHEGRWQLITAADPWVIA